MKNPLILLAILLWMAALACTSSSDEGKSTDKNSEVRLIQYRVEGKKLYNIHCANCHQQTGEGLAKLYPPLAKSDYLMSDMTRVACIIRNGMSGEIEVNGSKYNQMMPGNAALSPLEVAEIITYVSNSWENEAGISATLDVTRWLENCKQ